MDLQTKVIAFIFNFIQNNKQLFIPKNENEKLKIEDDIVEKLSEDVFKMIFGENLNKATFDLKKHFHYIDGQNWIKANEFSKLNKSYPFNDQKLKESVNVEVLFSIMLLLQVMKKGGGVKEFIKESESFSLLNLKNGFFKHLFKVDCRRCSTPIYIGFNSEKKQFMCEEEISVCPCPKGENVFNFSLKLPSRKLIFVNDIREVFSVKRKNEYDVAIGTNYGNILECQEYLKHNIASIQLSSGSIEVLHSKNEKLVVIDFDKETYYKENNDGDVEPLKGFRKSKSIVLGVWRVFVMDESIYKKICKEKGFDPSCLSTRSVKVDADEINFSYDTDKLLLEGKYIK